MKIQPDATNIVQGNLFSGFYKKTHDRGIRGKLYEFSSPSYNLLNFDLPYDAYLAHHEDGSSEVIATARRLRSPDAIPTSDRTGALYYYDKADLYGVCHGFGQTELTFYNGYNFYNSFYPAGYFTPPFGETVSIFKSNLDGATSLQNGACAPLSITQYNELFGIVSKSSSDAALATNTLTPNVYSPIFSPAEVCPPEVAITSYYDEINFTQIPGTVTALGGNTIYSNNIIPTSLDNFDIKVNSRYSTSGDHDGNNYVLFDASGRPSASYSYQNQTNKLNNTLCQADLMETRVSQGRGTNGGQLLDSPDILFGNQGDQVSFVGADPWHYWHFTFRENADSLPFSNNFTPIDSSVSVSHRTISQGTQLFVSKLSSEEMYWKNRQCPDTVDFLPWNFGGAIYACPSEHFDVPYYAAIKKFGFYGTRFLNSCSALNLTETWSGVDNAQELPQTQSPLSIGTDLEPDGIDIGGNWSFSDYDNLLKIAKAEERYSNMYALNKGFFLWANSGYLISQPEYSTLKANYPTFELMLSNFLQKFQFLFSSGLSSFTGTEPVVMLQSDLTTDAAFTIFDSGLGSDLLFTTDAYDAFRRDFDKVITGNGIYDWQALENKFGYYVSNGVSVNEPFYAQLISGRERRLATRYFENSLRGNPIDLFPLNEIYFSFDKAKDYYESTGWGRTLGGFGKNTELPAIDRRYFQGAYGNASAITGVVDILADLSLSQNTFFYPGFFNDIRFNKTSPQPKYQAVVSGLILDTAGRSYTPSGWLAIGYNEIGGLDKNFSCFTPIFVQSPLPSVFCKIGQRPTFRSFAVDYHSIPDDKISYKYPEIAYWCEKLKLFDANKKNLYPVKYKWHRVKKTDYNSFIASGNFALSEESNPTGTWCCLEGDSNNCTLIHPNSCVPTYSSTDAESYTFLQGVVKDQNGSQAPDDAYYYFCLASGRFGVRISNPSELVIEDWLRFDVSFKNASNQAAGLSIAFEIGDVNGNTRTITFNQDGDSSAYNGYETDVNAIPEAVIEQKVPPPNAGYGNVTAYRFVGPIGYVGATRSYKPSTLEDTRGLRESWGHLLDYGALIPFAQKLTQDQGDLLYGYSHLPVCDNYQMTNGRKGIKVVPSVGGFKVGHWVLPQKAVASSNMMVGVTWDRLNHIGELYPPVRFQSDVEGALAPNLAIGQWQWGNNLGAIKRFGYNSNENTDDMIFVGGAAPKDIPNIKKKLLRPTDLAGENCGYTKYGVGRNMLYYIEAFERFYLICDVAKKKNVQDISFMCPGLRQTNSATQYFWLGKPSNTYLERRNMYGPYAYQWRVGRHNRDRNGNGMSEGFYSMGWATRFELLYDAPAIYGLYIRPEGQASVQFRDLVQRVIASRSTVGTFDLPSFRNTWFGEGFDEDNSTYKPYGNIFFSCSERAPGFNETICDYVSLAKSLAGSPDFRAYTCPENALKGGACFDPCMSIRYGQGFFPGGKSQDMFVGSATNSRNLPEPKSIKLVNSANLTNDALNTFEEQSQNNRGTYFRSPIATPHAQIWQGFMSVDGFDPSSHLIPGVLPCQDGGSDHCNYMTATIHLGQGGVSSTLLGQTTAFNDAQNSASNFYEAVNIRGEID